MNIQNMSSRCVVLLLLLIVSICKGKSLLSIEKSYEKGVKAYSGERWSECIAQFEESLHLYKLYKSIFNNCGMRCKSQESGPYLNSKFEDLSIYEKFLNEGKCLITCRQQGFQQVNLDGNIDESILLNMKDRKPYGFLHGCYFQMYALPKAASAAYTYLMAHPDDSVMKSNLKYYSEQPEVDVNEVVDFESEDFEVLHKVGIESYNEKKYGETIVAMEEVLTDFFAWDKGCCIGCEHLLGLDQEESPEFVITVSKNILAVLECRQQCQNKLTSLGYKSGIEFLADILNYLQISYYHSDRFEDAAQMVASYLTLLPHDEDMLQNKDIYGSLVDEKAFRVRSDIIHYLKRDLYEKELLSQIYHSNTFSITSNSIDS